MAGKPYSTGFLETIVGVHFGFRVYVIIVGGLGFTVGSKKGKVLDVQSTEFGQPSSGNPLTYTLLECDSNAGDGICTQHNDYTNPFESGFVDGLFGICCPHTPEVRANWASYPGIVQNLGSNDIPPFPYFFITGTMLYGAPVEMRWKVRSAPHKTIAGAKMIQLYPTTGDTFWVEAAADAELAHTAGWSCRTYRLDKKGVGTPFTTPSTWSPDPILIFNNGSIVFANGILFGENPPPFTGDVPLEP